MFRQTFMTKTPDIYLTPELKSYYMSDFNSNVLNQTNEFWGLDNGVKDHLIKINSNPHMQTLYSRKRQFKEWIEMFGSYIEFTYTKDVELKIFREIIPFFLANYNTKDKSKFSYLYIPPRPNPNKDESSLSLGCLNDKNYFNVNHLKFEMDSNDRQTHNKFWKDLETKLSELNT